MKLTATSAILLGMAMPSLLNAQGLEDKWNMEEPTFVYDDNVVTFGYRFGSPGGTFFTDAKIYKYNDFDDIQSDTNCRTEIEADNFNLYSGSALSLETSAVQFADNTVSLSVRGSGDATVSIDTALVEGEADIYTEFGQGQSRIAFCVRYGLFTGEGPGGNNYEVNFLETLVEINVDLTGDFEITGIQVAPKDRIRRTANIDYDLTAFQCTGTTADGGIAKADTTTPFNQGDVITVCVQPDEVARDDDVFMRQVTKFEYILLEAGDVESLTIRQMAIDVDDAGAGTRGAMFGLTSVDECRGNVACKIDTILFAMFYARQGTVVGRGSGIMQFGTATARKLRGAEDRALQADDAAAGDFDVTFNIANNDSFQGDSAASGSVAALALFGSVVSAFLMM